MVPEGTTVHVYAEMGDGILDSAGRRIETGGDVSPVKTYGPGSEMPNLELTSPRGDLTIHQGSTTVENRTPISELLSPNMGTCHWVACLNRY